jgi:hypothetical protein
MNIFPDSPEKEKSGQAGHHDAWSGWGIIIGTVTGIIIGLFVGQALLLGVGLGVLGWIVGALVDRSRR